MANPPNQPMTNAPHTIEWTRRDCGDVGIRDNGERKGRPVVFPNRREAIAECCRLNERSESYRYRPIVLTPGMSAGIKLRGSSNNAKVPLVDVAAFPVQ